MEKQKEECKNPQQSKVYYNDFTIEELEKILDEIFSKERKNKKMFGGNPFMGRPNAQKSFDEAVKREYKNWKLDADN